MEEVTENLTNRGAVSQNGWSVISQSYVRNWTIGGRTLPVRRGAAGFVLAHWTWYFNFNIETLLPTYDDWGWALRRIAGSNEWSNHASGTAVDLNADAHPQGRRDTFTPTYAALIRERLGGKYDNLITWGGDYSTTVDEMHYEINGTYAQVKALADKLEKTNIGVELRKGQS